VTHKRGIGAQFCRELGRSSHGRVTAEVTRLRTFVLSPHKRGTAAAEGDGEA
jgi:hypothetical protein